jgi:hypothetical protein
MLIDKSDSSHNLSPRHHKFREPTRSAETSFVNRIDLLRSKWTCFSRSIDHADFEANLSHQCQNLPGDRESLESKWTCIRQSCISICQSPTTNQAKSCHPTITIYPNRLDRPRSKWTRFNGLIDYADFSEDLSYRGWHLTFVWDSVKSKWTRWPSP